MALSPACTLPPLGCEMAQVPVPTGPRQAVGPTLTEGRACRTLRGLSVEPGQYEARTASVFAAWLTPAESERLQSHVRTRGRIRHTSGAASLRRTGTLIFRHLRVCTGDGSLSTVRLCRYARTLDR
jgi:hypothetical protein